MKTKNYAKTLLVVFFSFSFGLFIGFWQRDTKEGSEYVCHEKIRQLKEYIMMLEKENSQQEEIAKLKQTILEKQAKKKEDIIEKEIHDDTRVELRMDSSVGEFVVEK